MRFLVDFHEWIKNIGPNAQISSFRAITTSAIRPSTSTIPSGTLRSADSFQRKGNGVTDFLADGFIDSFRERVKEPDHYSWWSYRANARANNKGWRIDYQYAQRALGCPPEALGHTSRGEASDHCPILVELA